MVIHLILGFILLLLLLLFDFHLSSNNVMFAWCELIAAIWVSGVDVYSKCAYHCSSGIVRGLACVCPP